MVGGLHTQSLYTQRNEEMTKDEVTDTCNYDKTNAVFFIQRWKEKLMKETGRHYAVSSKMSEKQGTPLLSPDNGGTSKNSYVLLKSLCDRCH